jgi:hypothetical protein
MSGVFRNINPPPPHPLASVYSRAFGAGVKHTRWVERWWGVNSSEDASHCSVLYICKYFVHTGRKKELHEGKMKDMHAQVERYADRKRDLHIV